MPTAGTPHPGPLSIAIAEILKQALAEAGASQRRLGATVGISQSQISKYLRAERVLDIDQLDALCFALGLNIVTVVREAEHAARSKR
ncbi:helix-turn-helix domain-containing protein [Cryobacterium soli]|uniref:helix-turn-helix domain-containing protein n=1 Tax=Cryobacterium soli TaxID=2220095 RepID=UPI000E75D370|nr:helix-turn-helix transcriptional regulator [Cryobacterium soli]